MCRAAPCVHTTSLTRTLGLEKKLCTSHPVGDPSTSSQAQVSEVKATARDNTAVRAAPLCWQTPRGEDCVRSPRLALLHAALRAPPGRCKTRILRHCLARHHRHTTPATTIPQPPPPAPTLSAAHRCHAFRPCRLPSASYAPICDRTRRVLARLLAFPARTRERGRMLLRWRPSLLILV